MFSGHIFKHEHEKHDHSNNQNTKQDLEALKMEFTAFKETSFRKIFTELNTLSKQNQELSKNFSDSQYEVKNLRSSSDEAKERLNLSLYEFQKLWNNFQEANEKVRESQNEIKKLNAKLNILLLETEQLKSSHNEFTKLENSLVQIQTLRNKLQDTDEKSQISKFEIEQLKFNNAELLQKLESSNLEIEQLKTIWREKEKTFEDNNSRISALEAKIHMLSANQEIKIVETQIDDLDEVNINPQISEIRYFDSPLPSPSLLPETLTPPEDFFVKSQLQPHRLLSGINANLKKSQTMIIPSEPEKLMMEEFERTISNLISDGSWDGEVLYEDDWGNEIAERFPLMHELKFIGLIGCGFVSLPLSDLKSLAVSLRYNTVLQLLDLGYKSIGDVGAKIIANALQDNNTLQVLYLYDNNIKNDGVIAIASMLHYNSSLKFIHLGNNDIEDVGILTLAGALHSNNTLQILVVENNKYRAEGFEAITNARHKNPNLLIQHNYED
ncbi:hypothetical protein HK096_006720 [Nowakowskiella sp. JEL0078]|nr:hypothetical protein HK096_006720 [Nowakowskiella sp. JEL0078]